MQWEELPCQVAGLQRWHRIHLTVIGEHDLGCVYFSAHAFILAVQVDDGLLQTGDAG